MKKICVVTGTRAEYGLFYWTLKAIERSAALQLQLLVTGTHLREEFGNTYKDIEADGFKIDEKIQILSDEDSPLATAKSTGTGMVLFSEALTRLKPDLLLVLGDRFESLAAVTAALFLRIPVAHIGGGDTTEGAFDESIRHSITKMSHFHFVTNQAALLRVRQLGEDPRRIYNVGNPGLEYIARTQLLSRADLETDLQIKFKERIVAVTFHPVTLEEDSAARQISEVLQAVESMLQDQKTTVIFTKSNADSDHKVINEKISEFVRSRPDTRFIASLGNKRYLSLLSHSALVLGNSSSGLCEAPSFKIPTINIGDRQKGRLSAESVFHTVPIASEILDTVKKALAFDCSGVVNPYGNADSSEQICKILETQNDYKKFLKKHFYEL